MADRYLVGTGNRNWNNPSIWSDTSGGAPLSLFGSELISGGDFESGLIGNVHPTITGGAVTSWALNTINPISGTQDGRLINSVIGTTYNYPLLMLPANIIGVKNYCLTFDYKINSGNFWLRFVGSIIRGYSNQVELIGSGTKTVYFQNTFESLAQFCMYVDGTKLFDVQLDNFSLKEVLSIPTSSDNVIFDNNSGTGTITVNGIANMLDFTCTNIGALTLSNAAYAFNVYGSLTLHTSLTVTFTSTGYLYMKATDSRNITTNGKAANWNRMYFDGVGGTWTNQDDMSITQSALFCVKGTWNTNNKTILVGERIAIIGNVTINYGSSIITAQYYRVESTHTVNTGTSTINSSYYFWGGGKTYYNVVIGTFQGKAVTGANTFNNLSFLPNPGNITDNVSFDNNQLINGNLTINGYNSNTYRLLVTSNIIGTPRTITCNGTVTASNVDFRDIVGAGTANWDLSNIAGGSGDCGGNSGITFTTAQPQWYKHTSGACSWSDATKWFSNVEKTVAGRVPLPQDDATFDATSFTGVSTLNVNCPRMGGLDMSGVNQAVTINETISDYYHFGDLIYGNNIVFFTYKNHHLQGVGEFILKSGTITPYFIYNIYIERGSYVISDIVSCYNFIVNGGTLKAVENSLLSISSTSTGCNFSYSSGTIISNDLYIRLLNISGNTTINFQGGGKVFNKVQFSGSHTGNFDISGNNTISELIIDSGRKVRFTAGTTQTIAKATIGANVTINSITEATHTLNYTGGDIVTAENLNVKNSTVLPLNRWYAEGSSINSGNNNNWIFGDYYTPEEIYI